jgi:hypothetical protein
MEGLKQYRIMAEIRIIPDKIATFNRLLSRGDKGWEAGFLDSI